MHLKILAHPVFVGLNLHLPMIVDLSHPLILIAGENGSGKSTLLHSLYLAFRAERVDGYVYRLEDSKIDAANVFLFDAEQHNPRKQQEFFADQPEMLEFLSMASHGQVMLSLFSQTFPSMPDGTTLLLDEPEMALSQSNQRRVLKMLKELVAQKRMRIIAATHSPVLIDDPETYVIDLDRYVNRNVMRTDLGIEGKSTIQ
jgi:predicted ATPase